MDDSSLIREYAEKGSDEAFRTLTERYLNLVYSAARRQTASDLLAEEITQAVFIVLARKAGSLRSNTILPAWLLQTTRFTAVNAIRKEIRRQQYEREAMDLAATHSESERTWQQIAPMLDEALVDLAQKDRDIVVLRFFQRKSFREIAETLHIKEDAAQKRVDRALDKLRAFFQKRGETVSAIGLTTALAANSVQAAPTALKIAVLASAVGVTGAGTGAAGLLSVAALKAWQWIQIKKAASIGGAFSVAFLAAYLVVHQQTHAPLQTAPLAPSSSVLAIASHVVASEPSESPAKEEMASGFRFRVLDEKTGNPVPEVRLTVSESSGEVRRPRGVVHTDTNGWARLPSPGAPSSYWLYLVEVYADGYVPKYVSWGSSHADDFTDFPVEYTTRFERGTLIGGIVQNERGEPLPGVELTFSQSGPSVGSTDSRERWTMMGDYHSETTDGDGRWRCDHVPARFGMLEWSLAHAEYAPAIYAVEAPENPGHVDVPALPTKDLLTQQARMTMKPGRKVTGEVVNQDGDAIPGAMVRLGNSSKNSAYRRTTDATGYFEFRNVRVGKHVFTVMAENFAPTYFILDVEEDFDKQRIVLGPPQHLRGKVVDSNGEPVFGASISTPDEERKPQYDWSTKSDTNGVFEWKAAPTETSYRITAAGFQPKTILLMADGTLKEVKLKERAKPANKLLPMTITVLARDAESGAPIEKFKMFTSDITERKDEDDVVRTSVANFFETGVVEQGQGKLTANPYATSVILQVEASGYIPYRTTNKVDRGGKISIDAVLQKSVLVEGIVESDGKPVSDTLVLVLSDLKNFRSYKPHMQFPRQFQVKTYERVPKDYTDAKGNFAIDRPDKAEVVAVAHTLGFAWVDVNAVEQSKTINLKPWGSVEGVLKFDTISVANQNIHLSSSGLQMHVRHRTKTDETGHFAFQGVPPGDYKVTFVPGFRDGKTGFIPESHDTVVTVSSGETNFVQIAGSGRDIRGKVIAPEVMEKIDWLNDVHKIVRKADEGLWASDPAAAFRQQRSYVLLFKPDGTFFVEDVPPDVYKVWITPRKKEPATFENSMKEPEAFGSLGFDLVVPNDGASSPLDLGDLILNVSGKGKSSLSPYFE